MRRVATRIIKWAARATPPSNVRVAKRRRPSTLKRRRVERAQSVALRAANSELMSTIATLRAESVAAAAPSVVVSPALVLPTATARNASVAARAVAFARANPELMLLNVGMISSLTGFMMSNVLHLRALSVFGSICGMIYNTKNKVWPSVMWGGIFVAVNCTMITMLLLEQRPVAFDDDDYAIYAVHFADHGVRPKQFQRLLNAATRESFPQGAILKRQGESSDQRVMLIVDGAAEVHVGDSDALPVAVLTAGERSAVIGEIMLLEFLKREKLLALGRARKGARAAEVDSTVVETAEHAADMRPTSAPASAAALAADAQRTAFVVDESGAALPMIEDAAAGVGGDMGSGTESGGREGDGAAPAPAQSRAGVTVTAGPGANGCAVLSWTHSELHALLAADPHLSTAMYNVLTDCLMCKLAEQNDRAQRGRFGAYIELLRIVTSGGAVSAAERAAVCSYRERHVITEEEHRSALGAIGWSVDEMEYGAKGGDPITKTLNRAYAAASVVFDPAILGLKWA